MSWPVPAPGDVTARYAQGFATAFARDPDGVAYADPPDTTSPDSVFHVLGVVAEETYTDLYLFQRSLADELMPDTAQDWLPRHASEWGVPRLLPLTAVGALVIAGAPGTPLPAGIEAYTGATRYITRAAAVIPGSGAVSIPAESETAGAGQDLVAGTVLTLVSPVAGVNPQSAVVDAGAMLGSRALEDPEAWRARILRRIRSRGRAGTVADYADWAQEAGAVYWNIISKIGGAAGTVGVVIAMAGPRAPNSDELARVAAYIDIQRSVTAEVVVIAASTLAVPVAVAVAPDTLAVRAAVTAALQSYFAREQQVGLSMPLSRIDEAISSASGEYANALTAPAVDVAVSPTQIPVLGAVTFTSGAALPQPPDGF